MATSAVIAALRDALEKGDVLEQEEAITAAEDALKVSAQDRKTSSTLGSLIMKAKRSYSIHMDACSSYLRPLRKACKELNERGIFDALVTAREAPYEVQLYMYTDLCSAESLRHEMVEARRAAAQLLESGSASELEKFLNECAPILNDKIMLAIVQRREDLLREERMRPRRAAPSTPLRLVAGSNKAARFDPLGELGRFEVEDREGQSPFMGPHNCFGDRGDSSIGRVSSRDVGRQGIPLDDGAADACGCTSARYPTLPECLQKTKSTDLEYVIAAGSSPWTQAMRALRQRAFDEVHRDEQSHRHLLEAAEEEQRASVYRGEMMSRAPSWTILFSALSAIDQAALFTKEAREAKMTESSCEAAPVRFSTPAGLTSTPLRDAPPVESETVHLAFSHAPSPSPHPLFSYALRPAPRPLTPTRPLRDGGNGAPAAEGVIIGSAVRHGFSEDLHVSRKGRDTPNISPIKEMSSTSAAMSSIEPEQPDRRWDRQTNAEGRSQRDTPRGSTPALGNDSNTALLPLSTPHTSSPSLEQRRLQARVRATQQEEEMHRRDIEGTEDFDRSVFLFPVSARIALMRRTAMRRGRHT